MKVLISQVKSYLGDMDKNLQKITAKVEEGIKSQCDVAVFPELALNGTLLEDIVFDMGISNIPEKLLELSHKITIIFGAVEAEGRKLYNTGYCLENGKTIGKHRKVFLSNNGGNSESRYFTRGKEITTFESKHGVFAITLGEEGMNPFVNGILGVYGAEVVFNLTNEISDVRKEELSSVAGAINSSLYNKNFNIVVNRCGTEDGTIFAGNSFAVSPYGKIIKKMPKFEEDDCIVDLDLKDLKRAAYSSGFDREDNLEIIKKEIEKVTAR